MPLKVKTVESVPPLVRGGAAKNAEENEQIRTLLNQVGVHHFIEDITDQKQYQSLQQRIRSLATSLNLKVSIQRDTKLNGMYFWSTKIEPEVKTTSKK